MGAPLGRTSREETVMEVVYPRCCGLDIHKKLVVACLITPGDDGAPRKEVRSFGTMTDDLLALGDWLVDAGCTHVAMESTGVYWRPLYNLLEESFTLLLVNAQHIKAVPGRKTDVRDCEWIADLLRHGLLRASFVPDRAQRELRDLTRYRTALVQERSAEVNRLQKTLEGANIKLAAVATDVLGKSGRQILERLVGGATDAAALAQVAKGRLRQKLPQLERALVGRFGAHQRFLVARQLAHIDDLDETIAQVSAEIAERLGSFEAELARLDEIPGVGRWTAEVIVAELGTDMGRFPTDRHAASWAALCPGNHESAGKRQSGKTRKGNRYLRAALTEAAQAAGRTKDTYLAAQYRRLAARRGKKRAALAVGHTILIIAYHLLRDQTPYQDLGGDYFERRDQRALEHRLVQRLEALGNTVTIERRDPAA
ncbi:MAG TPA: IS110 family transposase [Mycobacteriales bacterium]|nr:IS110 family transposase [Mycobacteriales bacterium]